MSKYIFAVSTMFLALIITGVSSEQAYGAWPVTSPVDSHPCYTSHPDTRFEWCNMILPSQRFSRDYTRDRRNSVTITYNGTDYHVGIIIEGVWNPNGTRAYGCNSTSATPAAFYNQYECAYNYRDPYYQNWDTCEGGTLKMMLYCWPAEDSLYCWDADGNSGTIASFLNGYLNNSSNLMRPSTTSPRLDPAEDSYHVYAKRASGSVCPNYPSGC